MSTFEDTSVVAERTDAAAKVADSTTAIIEELNGASIDEHREFLRQQAEMCLSVAEEHLPEMIIFGGEEECVMPEDELMTGKAGLQAQEDFTPDDQGMCMEEIEVSGSLYAGYEGEDYNDGGSGAGAGPDHAEEHEAETVDVVSEAPSCDPENSANPADWRLKATDVKSMADRNFSRIDSDGDGYLSEDEIDNAMVDPCFQGADAQFVATLKEHREDLEELSNDEWGDEDDGVTIADIRELDRLSGLGEGDRDEDENKLIKRVNGTLFRSGDSIENANRDLFPNGIDSITPDAIDQGQYGDCYLLAAIGSLAATNPQAIKDMIQDNGDGTYTVTFPGDPDNPVTVSAPTDSELARYQGGSEHGTWPAILEKAYGEYYDDDYTVPQDGVPEGSVTPKGVDILSPNGYDSDLISLSDADEIDRKLQEAIRNGMPITAGINNEFGSLIGVADNLSDDAELQGGHAYSITGYDPATRTVTVRNPWGSGEPVDADGNALDGTNDGTFQMPLDQFMRNFDRIAYGQAS